MHLLPPREDTKAPYATAAVQTIADFFDGIRSTPEDPVTQALGTLRREINFCRRLAEEDLGALSRNKNKLAARTECIGWLRESILRLSGQPNHKHVMTLAQIVCDTSDIYLHHVRKSVYRDPRPWAWSKKEPGQKT
jgi:hypothetical protein